MIKKRLITVPKDKFAECALDADTATKEQLIERSLNDEEFMVLYQSGLFELINKIGNANIDDYEDDFVKGEENIKKVINVLVLEGYTSDSILNQLIIELKSLFEEALSRGTAVYFYF